MTRVAFHAPMKPPDHPTPSGDREIARLTLKALSRAGYDPYVASTLRSFDATGDVARQKTLIAKADIEVARVVAGPPPAIWFTYHCYYKAPDLIGPRVSAALKIPYVISEPSFSARRLSGNWATFAEHAKSALMTADLLLWTTPRDLPGLEALTCKDRCALLPAFIDPGPEPGAKPRGESLHLITVAMMRPGDKFSSYQALVRALEHLEGNWSLTIVGDGVERPAVEALFSCWSDRVRFTGRIDDKVTMRATLEAHDLFVWPGIGEGIGMVYLEAQAAGLPALAEAHPGPSAVLAQKGLPRPHDPRAFAKAIQTLAAQPDAGSRARAFVTANHSLESAGARLKSLLGSLA